MARLPPGTLMQRAAAGLASMCAGLVGRVYGARVIVFAGSGDNGGDALYAGARLSRRGARVLAVAAGSRLHEGGAAALRAAGGRLTGADDPDLPGLTRSADLILDGLLGIGGRGGLRGAHAALAALAAGARASGTAPGTAAPHGQPAARPLVVAVDLPSGIDADTGEVTGTAIQADVTVTFGTWKPGLFIDPAASYAGVVQRIDIGLGPYLPPPDVAVLTMADVAGLLPVPGRDSDKYRRGVLGIVAGSERFTGAAALAVGGAIHGGAGMVRLVSAEPAVAVVRQQWPEAVITMTGSGAPAGDEVTVAGRVQAWLAGPGMGTDEPARRRLAAVLATELPVLVDADGLTLLAADPGPVAGRAAPTLLTPHAGELARLLGTSPEEVTARRVEHARAAAAKFGATVLLKGSSTVIAPAPAAPPASQAAIGDAPAAGQAAAGGAQAGGAQAGGVTAAGVTAAGAAASGAGRAAGAVLVNTTGTGWLATAGTGDVLSGLAGALMAQGLDTTTAAGVAAFLHGLAARRAAWGGAVQGLLPADGTGQGAGGQGVAARAAPARAAPARDAAGVSPPEAGEGGEAPIGAGDVVRALPGAIRAVRAQAR